MDRLIKFSLISLILFIKLIIIIKFLTSNVVQDSEKPTYVEHMENEDQFQSQNDDFECPIVENNEKTNEVFEHRVKVFLI